jgi:hypothetical protein
MGGILGLEVKRETRKEAMKYGDDYERSLLRFFVSLLNFYRHFYFLILNISSDDKFKL